MPVKISHLIEARPFLQESSIEEFLQQSCPQYNVYILTNLIAELDKKKTLDFSGYRVAIHAFTCILQMAAGKGRNEAHAHWATLYVTTGRWRQDYTISRGLTNI